MNKFYRGFGKLFGNSFNLKSHMDNAITVCPEERQDIPPAIYLPAHLERIKGVSQFDTLQDMLQKAQQTYSIHAPTLLIPLGKIRLFGGGLWTHKNEFITRNINRKDKFPHINLNQAVVTDSDFAYTYFGHWMHDAAPATLVGTVEIPSVSLRNPHYPHAIQYQKLFNLNHIYGNKGVIESAYLLSDFSQNSSKKSRYLTLRDNIKHNLQAQDTSYAGVFIARGQLGLGRTLTNELEVINHLQNKGFDIIYPEKLTAEAIARRLWNAKIVITVEGSAFSHAIYSMALTGVALILQPPNHFVVVSRDFCSVLGMGWGFYVCAPSNDEDGFYVDSFSDLDKVLAKLLETR